MVKHLSSFLILTVVAGALIGVLAFMRPGQKSETQEPIPLLAADETPATAQTTTILAPNGKMVLIMNEKKETDGISHTFFVSDSESGARKEIFNKKVPAGDNIEVPYNTFSPDNRYIFLKEIISGSTSYFVISTADGIIFNVSEVFNQKLSADFLITDVTGWGGMTLLVVNTDKVGGGMGPSFWFEPPASFIRLSTRFH